MCWCGCQAWRRGCCQGHGASAGWWLAGSHLVKWRGEQWHLASLPLGYCSLGAHSTVWQERRQGWLVALVGREQEREFRTVLSLLLQSHTQRHHGPARLPLEEGEACRLCSLSGCSQLLLLATSCRQLLLSSEN